MLSIATKSTTS